MIILKSNKIKTNFKEELKKYQYALNYGFLQCPYCNSSELIRWGNYSRNIYYINGSNIEFDTILIQRVKCKNCNHTHALLPEYIIPYKQYLLDVIIFALSDDNIIYNFSFSDNTILKWYKQFNSFLPYLKTMFFNISKSLILNKLKHDIFKCYDTFFMLNNKILMMIHPGVVNLSYF